MRPEANIEEENLLLQQLQLQQQQQQQQIDLQNIQDDEVFNDLMSKYGHTRGTSNYPSRRSSSKGHERSFRGLTIEDSDNSGDDQGIFRLTSPTKKDS